MSIFTKGLRKANVLFFQQKRISMHPIRNQHRAHYTKIMNRKNQYIATKLVFSYRKKKKYNIRAIHIERHENTTTQTINTQSINQRKPNDNNKSNVEETLKETESTETNFLSGSLDKNKEDEKTQSISNGSYLNVILAFFGIIYIVSTIKHIQIRKKKHNKNINENSLVIKKPTDANFPLPPT